MRTFTSSRLAICSAMIFAAFNPLHAGQINSKVSNQPFNNSAIAALWKTPRQSPSITSRDNSPVTEEFSFLIQDFKINHQGENNTLNLVVRYRYVTGIANSEYPDFRLIAKDLENALANYPNKLDYWEIVNKNLSSMILNKYRALQSITIEMQVAPSSGVPYTRTSTITRTRLIGKSKHKANAGR